MESLHGTGASNESVPTDYLGVMRKIFGAKFKYLAVLMLATNKVHFIFINSILFMCWKYKI